MQCRSRSKVFIYFCLLYIYTVKVFERKEGCPAVLCAIFQEVASKMGIFREFLYCDQRDRDDENFMDSTMNSPMLLLR